jgi:predicted nucleotidyltransferase
MKKGLVEKIEQAKSKYAQEGFIILGVFGSAARGEETQESDVDILYKLNRAFRKRYKGLAAFERIMDIREELARALNCQVDLADRSSLGELGRKYILPETIYV